MAAGERLVQARFEPGAAGDGEGFAADPRAGAAAAAVAEHDRGNAVGRRGHRMAIEQDRAAEAVGEQRELVLDRPVIGPVGLVEPLVELAPPIACRHK